MTERKRKVLTGLSGMAVIGCLCMIWYFSSQNGTISQDLSDGFSEKLLRLLESLGLVGQNEEQILYWIDIIGAPIRKCAHFAEYFLLALLTLAHLHVGYRKLQHKPIKAWIFVFLAASVDEIHQLFVPGRSGMVRDVLLDSFAGACAIIVVYFMKFMYTEQKKKRCKGAK